MARVNTRRVSTPVASQELTTNEAFAPAYTLPVKLRLIEQVLGAFWSEDTFYKKGSKIATQIVADLVEVAKTDPKFIFQLAAFARNEINLRTTPQVLLVEASYLERCKPFVEEYTPRIVRRADEITDVIAYHISRQGSKHNFANSLKRGLRGAFQNFDEYQFNKYKSESSTVSMADAVRLVHPLFKGNPEYRVALYNYITKGEVSESLPKISAFKALMARDTFDAEARELVGNSAATWESLTSKFGSTKAVWEAAIPKMGYMALLRNLSNFEKAGVALDEVIKKITDPESVKRSKQLPFRFYAAYQKVSDTRLKRALAQALDLSISNVTLTGTTVAIVDLSGSMGSKNSEKSDMTYRDTAAVMGAIVSKKSDNPLVIAFADRAAIVDVNPDDTVMTSMNIINKTNVGGSTNAWAAFELLNQKGIKADRVVLLSDMQCYNSTSWGSYRTSTSVKTEWEKYLKTNPKAQLYSFDLSALGTSQVPSVQKNVTTLSGWSDKVIDYMTLVEGKDSMEQKIKSY
jgi:hypothetical protein